MRIVKEEPVLIEVSYNSEVMKCVSNPKKSKIRRVYCYDKKHQLVFTMWVYPLSTFKE